jgi:hypothetical protein
MHQLKFKVKLPVSSKNSDSKCANYAESGRPLE